LAALLWAPGCGCSRSAGQRPLDPNQGWHYKLRRGDTIARIAAMSGRTKIEIAKANGFGNPAYLEAGRYIWIPPRGFASGQSAPNKLQAPTNYKSAPGANAVAPPASPLPLKDSANGRATPDYRPPKRAADADRAGFQWPIDPQRAEINRLFSATGYERNSGIDLKAVEGTPVMAARDGVVMSVVNDGGEALAGYGNAILIDHGNDFVTFYAHNQVNLVKIKQKVKRGQVIARVGSTDAEIDKLHFEIYKGSSMKPVDPLAYLPTI
jgi:lipoprotein NlpD